MNTTKNTNTTQINMSHTGSTKNITLPRPLNQHSITLHSNPLKLDQIVLYHNQTQIVLQLRQQFANEDNVLNPSIKIACELSPTEALALASALLAIATPRIHSALAQPPIPPKEQ